MQGNGKTFYYRIVLMLCLGGWSCQTTGFDPFETPPIGQTIALQQLPIASDSGESAPGSSSIKALVLLPPTIRAGQDSAPPEAPLTASFWNSTGAILSLDWSNILPQNQAECVDSDSALGDLLRNHPNSAVTCDPAVISQLRNAQYSEFHFNGTQSVKLTSWANISPSYFHGTVQIYMFPY